MAEYIEQEAGVELVEKLRYYANTYAIGDNLGREIEGTGELLFEAAEVIEKLIAADVAPVVRGRWELHKDGSGTCKRCHTKQKAVWDIDRWQNYCGHCGARMEESESK